MGTKAMKAAEARAKAMHALRSSMARRAAMKVIGQSSKGTVKASKVLAMKARVQSSKDAVKSSKATVQSSKAMKSSKATVKSATKKHNEWINAEKVTDALRAGLKAMKATVQSSKAKQSSVIENWSWYDVRGVDTLWVVATMASTGKGNLNVKAFGRLDV